jgi:hypothetical protein
MDDDLRHTGLEMCEQVDKITPFLIDVYKVASRVDIGRDGPAVITQSAASLLICSLQFVAVPANFLKFVNRYRFAVANGKIVFKGQLD